MYLERAFPDPEDIRALTAQNAADKATAKAGPANDLLDCDAILGQRFNGGVGIFSTKISLLLDPLGGGEQVGIDCGGANRGPDLAHRLANRIKEGAAGVLHQVPPVGHLDRLRQCLSRSQMMVM